MIPGSSASAAAYLRRRSLRGRASFFGVELKLGLIDELGLGLGLCSRLGHLCNRLCHRLGSRRHELRVSNDVIQSLSGRAKISGGILEGSEVEVCALDLQLLDLRNDLVMRLVGLILSGDELS